MFSFLCSGQKYIIINTLSMKQLELKALGLTELTNQEQMLTNGGDGEIGLVVLLVLLGLAIWGLITGNAEIVEYTEPDPTPLPEYM